MARNRRPRTKPTPSRKRTAEHDSVGGETVGGADEGGDVAAARKLARSNARTAVRTMLEVMKKPGRGAMAQLGAAQAVLKFASDGAAGDESDESDLDLTPADVELMKRFLEERAAKAQ